MHIGDRLAAGSLTVYDSAGGHAPALGNSPLPSLKRSMRPGFAGVENELYYNPKCMMLFGDAKDSITKVLAVLK